MNRELVFKRNQYRIWMDFITLFVLKRICLMYRQSLLIGKSLSLSNIETDSELWVLTVQKNVDSPIQASYVPSILTTRLPDCIIYNYTAFLYSYFSIFVLLTIYIASQRLVGKWYLFCESFLQDKTLQRAKTTCYFTIKSNDLVFGYDKRLLLSVLVILQ